MITSTAKYVKYSVCHCGFPALNEGVPIGKLYNVIPSMIGDCLMECGGCKSRFPIKVIGISDDGHSLNGYLPLDIFDLVDSN